VREKVLVPRKDHEIYIVPSPGRPRGPALARFASESLAALHPGFSGSSVFDTRLLSRANGTFLVITVMEKPVLAEYRLLHPRASFFTATSLLFDADGGGTAPPLELAGERVGITDSGEPFSLPQATPGPAREDEEERVLTLLKKAAARRGLFRKRSRAPLLAALGAALALLAAGTVYLLNAARPPPAPPAEAPPEKLPLPSVFGTLHAMAETVSKIDGTLLRWSYDENAVPQVLAAIAGPEAERLIAAAGGIPHIALSGISNVRYDGGKARYDAAFLFRSDDYILPRTRLPENGDTAIAALSAARAGITRAGASVSSETIPMPENGFAASIHFSGGRNAAEGAFSALEKDLPQYGARVSRLSVSREEGRFEIALAFVPAERENGGRPAPGWTGTVMDVFGAAVPPPSPPPRPAPAPPRPAIPEGSVKIGAIYDNDGAPHIYYRTKEGRVIAAPE
jgi:hypothetical protein